MTSKEQDLDDLLKFQSLHNDFDENASKESLLKLIQRFEADMS
jgi:hypothetical protein